MRHEAVVGGIDHRAIEDAVDTQLPDEPAEPLCSLQRILGYVDTISAVTEWLEAYHDASEALEEVRTLFSLGYIDLKQQAAADAIYYRIVAAALKGLESAAGESPPELAEMQRLLTDLYLCDFSVFQSMLDHWAIGQPFPIVPIASAKPSLSPPASIPTMGCGRSTAARWAAPSAVGSSNAGSKDAG